MLTYNDVRFIRDVIKETLETDDLENVLDELEEILQMLEELL